MLNLEKRKKKTGLPPGSLVYTGKKDFKTKITLTEYDKENFSEKIIEEIENCIEFTSERESPDQNTVKWIKVNGFRDVENLKKLGSCFNLHPLVLEDVLNTNQRPKVEEYDNYLYIVLKLFEMSSDEQIITKQMSFILEQNRVISFQDDDDPILELIIKRLKTEDTQIRNKGADFLLYSLIDTIIDSYFLDLESLEDKIEFVEENLIEKATPEVLQKIHNIKMDIITLRKTIWPLREMLSTLESCEYLQINKSTDYYLRDVYDHSIQVFDILESFRDRVSEMLDIYLSSTSNKLNEIVRVLTVISTVFIPATFIVGLYGMNFRNMPELDQPIGYPAVLAAIFIISVSMLVYFRKKKWI